MHFFLLFPVNPTRSFLSSTHKYTSTIIQGLMLLSTCYRLIDILLQHPPFPPLLQIPEFDNLYLDMNGIIHQCSHPNDEDVHFRISEEKIFADIFHYLEVLFRIIKPRKVFFMAVDGVAPRAKMNQQRGRRFR